MISTTISGTAFTAVSTNIVNRTDKEMSEEKIFSSDKSDDLQGLNLADKISSSINVEESNISYSSRSNSGSKLVFTDPMSGKYAIVSLSNSTIDMLKSHFGESDFYKRDDGLVRLDNKAEAYVAGWFADIAYKREFLSADSDKDGKLSSREYGNTKNSFSHQGDVFGSGDNVDINTWVGNTYQSSNSSAKNFINQMKDQSNITIDKQLNITINNDDNFDSRISFEEALTTHYGKNTKESIIQLAKDMVGIPKYIEDTMFDEKARKLEEKNSQKANAIEKVLSGDMELSVLNDMEKDLLGKEIDLLKDDGSNFKKVMNDSYEELLKMQRYNYFLQS